MSHGSTSKVSDKIMLGFIVRRCARELGHSPSPMEFADWANHQDDNGRRYSLFGRAITPHAAEIMLRHLGRLVTVRSPSAVVQGFTIEK
jgi:hypothetical protein